MKLATYNHHGNRYVVDVERKRISPLLDPSGAQIRDMMPVICAWNEPRQTSEALRAGKESLLLAEVDLLAPIPRPARNVFCVGKNYREHAKEFTRSGFDSSATSQADAIPGAPIIFTKAPECVIAHARPVQYPEGVSKQVDYEAELAIVIGKGGRGIARGEAMTHVWGYTIVNDVTARDLQAKHRQWFVGKSLDNFCPMGPWIVTADAFDPAGKSIRCWVNEELRQDANTSDLIFDIPTLIETLSAGITLEAGDVIATGTPAGVGIGFDPPRYLRRGDTVRIQIDGIGELLNRIA